MWIDLTDAEAAAIIEALGGKGSVVDKICARPCEGTGAFVAAAERFAIPNVETERFGLVKRDDDGAYVMCWRKITNEEADLFDNREECTSGEIPAAEEGDFIFSADLKICATVYVRAANIVDARKLIEDHVDDDLQLCGDFVGDTSFGTHFPKVEYAENATIKGIYDGCDVQPRVNLLAKIDLEI